MVMQRHRHTSVTGHRYRRYTEVLTPFKLLTTSFSLLVLASLHLRMVDKTKKARAQAKKEKRRSERLTQLEGHAHPSKSPTLSTTALPVSASTSSKGPPKPRPLKHQRGHVPDMAAEDDTPRVDDVGAVAMHVAPKKAMSTSEQEVGKGMGRETIDLMDGDLSEDIGTELEEEEDEEEEDELESETEVQPAERRERKGVF